MKQIPELFYWMHFERPAANEIVANFHKKTGLNGSIRFKEKSIELFNEICAQLERGYSSDNLVYANMYFTALRAQKPATSSDLKPNN
ncbi:MAG: hypothetical protein ABI325_10200 [Ginsengibacter sp.]